MLFPYLTVCSPAGSFFIERVLVKNITLLQAEKYIVPAAVLCRTEEKVCRMGGLVCKWRAFLCSSTNFLCKSIFEKRVTRIRFYSREYFQLKERYPISTKQTRLPRNPRKPCCIVKTYKSKSVLGESHLIRLGLGFSFFLPKLPPWIRFVNDEL